MIMMLSPGTSVTGLVGLGVTGLVGRVGVTGDSVVVIV